MNVNQSTFTVPQPAARLHVAFVHFALMLSSPDDYGLTAAQTLAHRIDSELPDGFANAFDAHWAAFREAVGLLPLRWQGAIDSPTNQVVIRSLDSVRVVARVTMPEPAVAVRGVVVTSHGYADVPEVFEDEPEPWTASGIATVRVRVRGYPPSTMDLPDLRGDWIMHKPPLRTNVADAWIVRGAVADVMQAVRCAGAHFGDGIPITLHGESLGGGLATIAAAQLELMREQTSRLILGVPTFGDWRWRATRYCNGSGGQINMLLDALRGDDRDNLLEGLLLYDAALHAPRITVPTLAALALLDDTVPAPTAAAIFNAIASHEKWRFVTRFGHYEGGIAHARRVAMFDRLTVEFADPSRSPEQAIEPHRATLEPAN